MTAIREVIDRFVIPLNRKEDLREMSIPNRILLAEPGTHNRTVARWADLTRSLHEILKLNHPRSGRIKRMGFLAGMHNVCAEYTRKMENVILNFHYDDSKKKKLTCHLEFRCLRDVPAECRHSGESFFATIPAIPQPLPEAEAELIVSATNPAAAAAAASTDYYEVAHEILPLPEATPIILLADAVIPPFASAELVDDATY